MKLIWDKKEIQEAAVKVFALMSQGKNDREIAEEIGVSNDELVELKAVMLDMKAEELRNKPIEHTYIEYMTAQLGNVRDLTDMLADFKNTKQYNAMVGAVRARAEIYDKLLTKGQDCGIIKKAPNRTEMVGGILVADLTNEELKRAMMEEFKSLKLLSDRYGDKDFAKLEIPKELHHGPKYELPDVIEEGVEVKKPKKKKKKKKVKRKKMKVKMIEKE